GYPGDQEVRHALRCRLPEYMIPSAVVTLPHFPFTPSGKLDRKALSEGSLSEGVVTPASAAQFDAPKDRLEEQLLGIWRHVLPRVDSNVSANFFDLGGHSLLAVQIFNHIQLAFGVRLPLATLFECPTIRQLAERIRAQLAPDAAPTQARWTTLVPMRTQGSLPPFFCVAGLGGNTLNLRFLGDHLGENQPFYGLQHRGVDGVLVPHSTIEEMAREFVAEIVALRPEGPYYIAGYSTGGLAAYEICQQLIARGAAVGLLILLDTFNPATLNWSLRARVGEHWKKVRSEGVDYVLERSVAHVRRRLENTRRRIRAHLANQNRFEYRMDAVVEATLAAEPNYVARPIDADVLLVQAVQAAPALAGIGYPPHESNGWRSLVCGKLDIVPIECHHLDLVSPRVAPTAAAAIRTALSGARGDKKESAG
ncbi:MAG: thioesterase domain-containing protein, partial [Myxococcales bacterium]